MKSLRIQRGVGASVLAAMLATVVAGLGCAKKNHPPEVLAAPSGPASGRTGADYRFWACANDTDDDDKVAVRFDWSDNDTSNWSEFVHSGDSACKSHIFATPGTFFVRAQARDLDRALSDWSSACSVVVLLDSNLPPQTPSIPSGPYYGQVYSTYYFYSSAVDPDNDSVCFRFAWGDGDTSDWSWFVPSGDSVYVSHYFSSADTYEIRAQAGDEGGRLSDWSTAHMFVVTTSGNEPPNTPMTPSGPSLGGIGISYDFTSSATDPDWDNVGVRFAWGDGDTSVWSAFVWSGEDVTMSHIYADSGVYLVTAQAQDEYGYVSAWSAAHTVTITTEPPPGALKWRCRIHAGNSYYSAPSSPAVGSDGTIYIGSFDHDLYAVNPDGSIAWYYPTGSSQIHSSPAIGTDGTVYVGTSDGSLFAISPDNTLKWRSQTDDAVQSSPAIGADGSIYVGSLDGYLYAFGADGAMKWRYQTGGYIYSSPAIGGDSTIYVGSADSYVYAISSAGTLKWRYPTGGIVACSPAIGADGTIYVGSADSSVYAISSAGTLRWRYQAGGLVNSSPAIGTDGTIYVGSRDNSLHAISSSGSLRWRYQTGGEVFSSPAIATDGTVYVGSNDGCLYAVTSGGVLRWRCRTGDIVCSSPAIGADGTIYVGSDDGYLYAVSGSALLATTPWPKFHHDLKNTGRVGGP